MRDIDTLIPERFQDILVKYQLSVEEISKFNTQLYEAILNQEWDDICLPVKAEG